MPSTTTSSTDGKIGIAHDSDQAVLVWDGTGRLSGCVVGNELGARRTGALGAAAVDALARPDSATVGIVGSGVQAWTQLWAISAVRSLSSVRIFSPTPDNREAFAGRALAELGLSAAACDTAQDAVADADIVVLATRAERPVVDAAWIRPGAHVNTVGPKLASAHETPTKLADAAAVVVTDSPDQAAGYGEPFFTSRPLTQTASIQNSYGTSTDSSHES